MNPQTIFSPRSYTPNQAIGGNVIGPTKTSTIPFVISGLKANQPGGLATSTTNTLPKGQVASPKNQRATGNAQNSSITPVSPKTVSSAITPTQDTSSSIVAPKTSPTSYTTPNGTITDVYGNVVGYTPERQAQINSGSAQTASSANNSSSFPGIVNQTTNAATGNLPIGQNAANIAAQYGKRIADVETQAAGLENAYMTTPGMAFPTSQGLAQSTAATAGQVTQGLASAEQAALQGTQQQLQAQLQAQQGLQGAGTLTQPSANFPFVFNPQTGTFAAPGAGGNVQTGGTAPTFNPQIDAQNFAQKVIKGQMTYQQAQQSMSYAGTSANNYLNSAITSAGGDPLKLEAQGAATQVNIQTQGTAATNAANAGYSQAIQQRADADAKYSGLTGVSNQVTATLANWKNSGVLTDFNQAINTLASKLSSPDYQAFIVALKNTQAAYQSILGSAGVTPSKSDQDALNALDENKSPQAIVSALNQLSKDAHSLIIEPAYSKVSQYEQQLGISQ